MSRRSRRKSRQLNRADTRRQLSRARKPTRLTVRRVGDAEPIWCDCCQDALATERVFICHVHGVSVLPLDSHVAAVEACPFCELGPPP